MTAMDHGFDATARDGLQGLVVHPAFPAIVAAWFAALGGFGWMMLPDIMVDSVASGLQLGVISTNLVPPVEFVGRASLAVVAAALAGGSGWLFARRMAARRSDEWGLEWQTFDIEALAGEPPIDGGSWEGAEPDRPARKRRWALAADKQGKYMEFHDALMAHRGAYDDNSLSSIAEKLGLNAGRMRQDAQSEDVSNAIQMNRALAKELGISSTPNFIIEDQLISGAIPYESMVETIEKKRKNKKL